jgi:hypothetical protein
MVAEGEVRKARGVCGSTGTDTGRAETTNLGGLISCAVFRRLFQAVAGHYMWARCEKAC